MVVATEEKTQEKFSSSATITVEVEDLNDNNPTFDLESYTASIQESSLPGNYIITSWVRSETIDISWKQKMILCKLLGIHDQVLCISNPNFVR